jgi:hypothetical protein
MVTLKELKLKAKRMGYRGYSTMRKAQLEKLLAGVRRNESVSLKDIRRMCMKKGLVYNITSGKCEKIAG